MPVDIGSLLTPLFAVHYPTKLAVALVSVPHLLAHGVFSGQRRQLDRRIFLNFGILSAVGGLVGALLNAKANSASVALKSGA